MHKTNLLYKEVMETEQHSSLSVSKKWTLISKGVILGASSDGLISCQYHGQHITHVKFDKAWFQ